MNTKNTKRGLVRFRVQRGLSSVAWVLIALLTVACATNPSSSERAEAVGVGVLATAPVHAQTRDVSGAVRWVRIDEGWAADVQAVRADQDALVIVGQEDLRLWLRAGAEVRFRRAGGQPVLSLVRGEIRIADRSGSDVAWFEEPGPDGTTRPTALAGRDLLATRARGALRVVDTLSALEAADWTLGLALDTPPLSAIGEMSGPEGALVLLSGVDIDARSEGEMLAVSVTHRFRNPGQVPIEGTFRFPLPADSLLTGLAMTVDGTLVEGEIVERDKAREIYERIVDEMRDPALLEWEQGRQLKLRVFPVEPGKTKQVVVRYLVPPRRAASGPELAMYVATPALQDAIEQVRVTVDGREVLNAANVRDGRLVSVPVQTERRATVRQVTPEGTFTRIATSANLGTARGRRGSRRVAVIMDTSRSALESWGLAIQTLEAVFAELQPRDRVMVMTSDVVATPLTDGFVGREALGAVLGQLREHQPDGASDLSAALQATSAVLGDQRDRTQVVYIGDGTPTWGDTEPAALRALVAETFGPVPLHAAIIGRKADATLMAELAGLSGGKLVEPKDRVEARRFGLFLAGAVGMPRLREARIVVAGESAGVHPRRPTTLFAGDVIEALVRQPESAPLEARLVGIWQGRKISRPLSVVGPIRGSTTAARRWAAAEIAHLTGEDATANKETIVALSKTFGVMSKHTALLVLENEEAYKRHQIERRRGPKGDPTVSGGDLESLSEDEARLSPDHIQPGDPEIRVPAPADAQSVVMVFPWGETKVAAFEPGLNAWSTRFLIPNTTPDGVYEVLVRVTHANGQLEVLTLDYVVDTQAPQLEIETVRRGGRWVLRARPVERELPMQRRSDLLVAGGDAPAAARLIGDVLRVEVALPDGRIRRLVPTSDGWFETEWRPRRAVAADASLRFVALDRARNRTVQVVPLHAGGE